MIQRNDASHWLVNLGPPQVPSVLEVICKTDLNPGEGQSYVVRPSLQSHGVPIPVEINLWSIGTLDAASTSARPSVPGSSQVSAGEQAVLRFDRLLSIAETATPAAIDLPASDGENWFRQWAPLLTRLRDEAANELAVPVNRQLAPQLLQPTEDQLAEASRRLDAWLQQCAEVFGEAAVSERGGESDHFSDVAPRGLVQERTYSITDGSHDRLEIDVAESSNTSGRARVLGTLAVLCLTIVAILMLQWPAAWDALYRWPHAVGFGVGLAYWAFLRPSWLGLLIAAASVAIGFRPGWPGRTIRLEASTVLRFNRPN
jgi:hypothetical protein